MDDRRRLEQWLDRFDAAAPGCAVVVVRDGEETLAAARGTADLERGVLLTPSSVLNLGSVSKQFTAFAVLLLEADGALSLDDDVRTHLPRLADCGHAITLRHLLHHTAGLRGTYPELLMLGGWRFTDHITQADCLRLLYDQRELSFAPGSEHLYINSNYVLLAEVVAEVSGTGLAAFSRERIFEPLGMADTRVLDDVLTVVPGRALGYYRDDDGRWRNLPLTDSTLGSTNVYTSAADFGAWLANLGTAGVGGPEVMARMTEPGRLDDGTVLGYAGGLMVGPGSAHRGRAVVEHGGQHGGYCTWMCRFPDDGLAVGVLCNHYVWNARELALELADLYLAGDGLHALPPTPAARRVEVAADDLEPLAGTFYDPTRRAVREVPFTGTGLTYQGQEMIPIGDGEFTFESEPGVTVRIGGDGLVLDTPDRAYTYRRVAPFAPAPEQLDGYAGRYESPELGVVWWIAVDGGSLVVRRHKYVDTVLRPLFPDAFVDDWTPILDFPVEYLVQFERDGAGGVSGLRVSGTRTRGIRFDRIDGRRVVSIA
ncbi:MAG: serine hydrolase [Actinobacteria bacterium]|nr:serine hydrolase [Actinomycetota bacterium]